jgi:hypothetical protein
MVPDMLSSLAFIWQARLKVCVLGSIVDIHTPMLEKIHTFGLEPP